jgi:hypothetical protein
VRLHPRKHGGDEFRVETRGRETIAYWEGDRAFLFQAAWAARPPTLYVPSERIWDEVVPTWLKGRRGVVVPRLAARARHRIVDADEGYAAGAGELRPITSPAEARAIGVRFLDRARGVIGPWTLESFDENDRGWRLGYRCVEADRYAPDLPNGRGELLIRRDTGEIEVV